MSDKIQDMQTELKATVLEMLQIPNTVLTSVEFHSLNKANDGEIEVIVKMKTILE